MDVQMPDMDGLAATAAVREREMRAARSDWALPAGASFATGRRIPIVAVTAHAMKGDQERCLAAGMDDFVTKPIRPAELASAIERLLPREILPFAKPASAPVDLEAARRLAAGDEELRAEVAAMFVESSRRHRAQLRDAVQATDWAAIEAITHGLRARRRRWGRRRCRRSRPSSRPSATTAMPIG